MGGDGDAVIRKMLDEARADTAALEQRRSNLWDQLQDADAQLHDLHVRMSTLEAVLSKTTPTAEEAPEAPASTAHDAAAGAAVEGWEDLNMTEAVLRVLTEATEPMSPRAISDRLGEVGKPQESTNKVRPVLQYLRDRRGLAIDRTRANWVLIGGPADTAGPIDTEERPVGAGHPSETIRTHTEGGGTNGAGTDRLRGDHSSGKAEHRVNGNGAPVVGAPR